MIITRTPLRVSFAGGMSDIPAYYEKDFGCVVSTAIDKYIYITVNKRFLPFFRIKYSQTENVDRVDDIQHSLVRECLKFTNITDPLEITSISDLPSQTGLGSSSAFAVGLLHALHRYKNEQVTWKQLAEEAAHIEIDILKNPIGKQDQYASSHGGCNDIRFTKGHVDVYPQEIPEEAQHRLLMFYLGKREATVRIHERLAVDMEIIRPIIDKIRDHAVGFEKDIHDGVITKTLGEWLDVGWHWKQKASPDIASTEVSELYELALRYGALGGKLLGEGHKGFLLVYAKPNAVQQLIDKLPARHLPFKFDTRGSMVLYDN